jgi:hypothetical protein
MSGKTGRRKPDSVRERSSKADGAFGKETIEQVIESDVERNVDKGSRKIRNARGRAYSGG